MDILHILVSTDCNYIPILKSMLHSLFENNRDCAISVHLLHSSLDDGGFSEVDRTVRGYGGKLLSYKIDESRNNDIMVKETRLPKETYYRLLCMDYLSSDVKKVLYLDCDIIINGSIKELYNTDMTGYLFAAAEDFNEVLKDYSEPAARQLEFSANFLPEAYKYVNAGVLLMNLEYFRKVTTTDEIISMIDEFGDILVWHDQDLINYVFHKHILYFDYKMYNYFPVYFDWEDLCPGVPAIIHYAGFFKPWKDDYYSKCEYFLKLNNGKTRRFVEQAKELYEKYAVME